MSAPPVPTAGVYVHGFVNDGETGSGGAGGPRLAFNPRVRDPVTRFNGDSDQLREPAERFPPEKRSWLILGLTGVTLVAIVVRTPFFGDGLDGV